MNISESKYTSRDDHSWVFWRAGNCSSGSTYTISKESAASDPHHYLLVPVPLLRRLYQEALLPEIQYAVLGTVVGKFSL